MDGSSRQVINDYTNATPQANGYALSQNVNHDLNTGKAISQMTAQEQAMVKGLDQMMVPIGKETTLYRATHDNFLQRLGIDPGSYANDQQLQQALVGVQWTEKGYSSTSHDKSKNPFWPGGYMSGGREVLMRVHTGSGTKAALIQSSQAETLLGRGTNYRITGARFTGQSAYPQKGGRKPVIEIDVDAW